MSGPSTRRSAADRLVDSVWAGHVCALVGGRMSMRMTPHLRIDDTLYLHSWSTDPLARQALRAPVPVVVGISRIDALVLGASAWQHALNHESVTITGTASCVLDAAERRSVLVGLIEHLVPGRSADIRLPSSTELARTAVLAVSMDQVVHRTRAGRPEREELEPGAPPWTGLLPVVHALGVPDPDDPVIATPGYLQNQLDID